MTGTSRIPFSDEYRNQVITQGLPAVVAQKLSALLVFGEHVPMKEMIEVYGFWGGGSVAATLSKNCLSRLSAWENDRSVSNEGDAKVGDAKIRIPVVDLWNWPKHTNAEGALSFIRQCMEISDPLITVCLGGRTIAALLAKFKP